MRGTENKSRDIELDLKGTKVNYLDLLACCESIGYCIENSVYSLLSILLIWGQV